METVVDRFMRYARVDTRSIQRVSKDDNRHPSSPGQKELIQMLLCELADLKVSADWVTTLGDGSFLIQIPATKGCENAPHVALTAHVDTYFGCPGGANPIIHEYNGGDIVLPHDGVIIPAADLEGLTGKRIISADGRTLLGGDDKCGVAAIVTYLKEMTTNRLPHGPLTIWICTDEEIGEVGVSFLPSGTAEEWDIFWTVDGKELDTVDIGCFYGAKVDVEFIGNDAHPGVEGQSLKPAHYAACRFVDRLGDVPTPWRTSGDQSFIYVPALPAGQDGQSLITAGRSQITVYPRTFQQEEIPKLGEIIEHWATEAAKHYGVQVVINGPKVMYVSTEVAINQSPHLLQPGLDALRQFGIKPQLHRVRAGTDGAMLNMDYPKIPAPNLGTGTHNLHGLREFVEADRLELLPSIISAMVQIYANMSR